MGMEGESEISREHFEFVREPATEPVPQTLYVAVVLTVEQRASILRGLSIARTRLRGTLENTPLTETGKLTCREQIRELDRLSSLLYEYPAYSSALQAVDEARERLT